MKNNSLGKYELSTSIHQRLLAVAVGSIVLALLVAMFMEIPQMIVIIIESWKFVVSICANFLSPVPLILLCIGVPLAIILEVFFVGVELQQKEE